MHKKTAKHLKKKPVISKKSMAALSDDNLRHLAFDNIAQANIITNPGNGKIIMVNSAACKMLGYSKKELLTQSRSTIFDIMEISFKKMLKQRTTEEKSVATVTAIKKSGKHFPCEITSAVFADTDGIEKAITTITDMSQSILKQKEIDTKKEKIVADNIALAKSKQKEVDTKKEKTVADNIALAKSKQKEVDTKKEKIVADDIALAKSKQKEVDSKKEKTVADDIALAKSKQKEVDIKKEKIVADNIILAEANSETNLAENSEWIKHISKTSYDVMWDWDIATNEIYAGESIKEVFGYTLPNNLAYFTDFISCLLPEEKDKVENKILQTIESGKKSWDDSFMFTHQDGSVAAVSCRANIVRDREGKAIRLIGALKDLSKLQELEKKLGEQNLLLSENGETFLQVANISFDVIWDRNLLTNEVIIGEGIEELLGYPLKDYKGKVADFSDHIHPDDKEAVERGLQEAIASSAMQWAQACRIVRADGSIAKVFDRASIFRHADGKAYRMIGAMQDVSRQKELEEKLDMEIAAKEKADAILAESKEKFSLITKFSTDLLWEWDLTTGEISVSNNIEELFGYTLKNKKGKATDWIHHVHPEDQEELDKSLHKAVVSSASNWEHNFRFIRADGSDVHILGRAGITRHSNGKGSHLIGALQDLSKQKELEEKLGKEFIAKEKLFVENEERIKLIFNSSSDVLIDIDLVTNKVLISDAYEKEFGYKINSEYIPEVNWASHIHPGDKEAVFKDYLRAIASDDTEWKYSYRFLKADDSMVNVFTRMIIMRDDTGNAYRIIGYIHDINKQTLPEEKLKLGFASQTEDMEKFRLLFNSSGDVLFDIDVEKNEVIFSNAYETAFGYKITSKMMPEKDWAIHIHPDDKERVYQAYLKRIASGDTEWNYQYRFIRSDNSVANISSTGIILRNASGKINRLLGVMHDISKHSELEERLAQEIKLKEKQMTEAIEEAKETERSDIGKELHDNVNQLLAASKLYLDMAKRGGEDSETYLSRSSEYTLMAIEEIRKLSKGLTTDNTKNLGLSEAINNLIRDAMEVNPVKIYCTLDSFIENRVNNKFKLNLYRMVQEQLNNILKHAQATEVTISLSQNKKSIMLTILDNGVGFDTAKKQKGIGLANIKSRASTYNGTADFVSQPGKGCVLKVTFPVNDTLLNKS